jgi:hypothetical protein
VFAVFTEDWAADGLGTLDPKVMAEDMGGPFRRQLAQRDRDPKFTLMWQATEEIAGLWGG